MTDAIPPDVLQPLVDLVRTDTADGCIAFIAAMSNREVPRHAEDEIRKVFADRDERGFARVAIEAFRGSTKSSTFTQGFMAHQIGLHPERSNLIVQASDESARAWASNVADWIEFNSMWRVFFPHVVKDRDKGWGAEGYWVWDSRVPMDEWVRRRHEYPTLLGASYGASIVVGKHPNGVFVIDDINDDKNTESRLLTDEVNRIVSDTLFPMLEDVAFALFAQTPWNKRDALAMVKATGVWKHIHVPVLVPDDDGELVEVIADDGAVLYSVRARLTWPEKFTAEVIALKYREAGGWLGFARMYLCRVDVEEGLELKAEWLRVMGRDRVDRSWVRVMGVDYASTYEERKARDDPDYLGISIGALIPGGGCVAVDGKLARVSQGEAQMAVVSLARQHGVLLIVVETWGSGAEFFQLLLRETDLPVDEDRGPRGKGYRYQKLLSPQFEFGRMLLAEGPNDFLDTFRRQWVEWPASDHDDALDAMYYMWVAATRLGDMSLPDQQVRRLEPPRAPNPWVFKVGRR